jgi:hypothetical protein
MTNMEQRRRKCTRKAHKPSSTKKDLPAKGKEERIERAQVAEMHPNRQQDASGERQFVFAQRLV